MFKNTKPMPEFGKDLVIYFNPNSQLDLSEKLIEILSEKEIINQYQEKTKSTKSLLGKIAQTKHGKNLGQFDMRDLNKILVLGANGMIGNSIFNVLSKNNNFNVYGTVRNKGKSHYYLHAEKIVANLDVKQKGGISKIFNKF